MRDLAAPSEAILHAVAAAIEAGADPSSDAEVRRIPVSTQIANAGAMMGVDDLAVSRFREVCTEHSEVMVKVWAKSFRGGSHGGDHCSRAHRCDVPLEDSATILRQGGDIATV